MRYGLWVNSQFPAGDALPEVERRFEVARMAHQMGFEAFWTGQHFLADPYQNLQQVPFLARLSAEVPGATIGTMVMLLSLYPPVLAAEELATLDILTGGKLVCGFAMGYREVENIALGSPANQRVGRLKEALTIIDGLWKGEPFQFKGRYFEVPEVNPTLLPAQKPRPPFWLAANSDGAVKRAAQLGDAWAIAPHSTLEVIKRQLGLYNEARKEAGKPPATSFPIRREVYVAPTDEEAWKDAMSYLAPKYETYRKWGQDTVLPSDDEFNEDFDKLARDRFIIGSPGRVAEELMRYKEELGITDLMMTSDRAGMPYELSVRSLKLFGEQVIPKMS